MADRKKYPEIMAPAGDFICLDAALKAGADAVYFGVKGFNMRVGAKNFEIGDLKRIVSKCNSYGAKAYLALNTVYFDAEIASVASVMRAAKRAGVAAVIAWDLSVVGLAQKIGIDIYLSTQASVANADALAQYYRAFGISRFVLARECGLGAIAEIKTRLKKLLGVRAAKKISIEVFAHGAMCVSVSGRCFMSQFLCGKSANRGECLQPCRREYTIADAAGNSLKIAANHVMSPRDLCTIDFLDKLIASGVDSLKIEGRNRNAEYVYNTTDAYVKARDFCMQHSSDSDFKERFAELAKTLKTRLSGVFNRGFSDGFYMGRPVGDWTSAGNESNRKKAIVGHVTNFYTKISVAEISIDDNDLREGDEIQIEGDKTGFVSMTASGIVLNNVKVALAPKGSVVGLKTSERLRRGDRIFKFLPSNL